jgi:hypothetical protein
VDCCLAAQLLAHVIQELRLQGRQQRLKQQ